MRAQSVLFAGLMMGCAIVPAQAQQIVQTFEGTQTIEQVAEAAARVLKAIADASDGTAGGYIEQVGLNGANIVFTENDLYDIEQIMTGQQIIENAVDVTGENDGLYQSGMNVTNLASARMIESAAQVFDASAAQWVTNSADVAGYISEIEQSGTNAANFAIAEYAIGTASQELAPGSLQKISNVVTFQATAGGDQITQSGTNLGNILKASKIDDVTRIFAGTQVIENTVYLGDNQPSSVEQSGINIANYVEADVVGQIYQITTGGSQTVTNKVYDSNGEEVNGASWLNQETVNMVNVMVIGGQTKSDTVDGLYINGELQVSQEADYPQSATGTGQQSQYGNVLSIQR